ncbi:MAG: site-specific integrase [Treponema sp.]|nr:site-specific integrase [Treponema sp.]
MIVIYFFCDSSQVRVYFFGYDPYVFTLLVNLGGVWNKAQRQFIFNQKMRVEQFSRIFYKVPCVWVEENNPIPLKVYGFFERPWDDDANEVLSDEVLPDKFLPDEEVYSPRTSPGHLCFFPEGWLKKLETELRSRKYSRNTITSYIYYNRILCDYLHKSPEEIQIDDIKKFLASMEKEKKYSSSSMNLAISAFRFFYANILNKDIIKEKTRPHSDKQLPMVLDKTEIEKILKTEKNKKHHLLLMLVYSSGLRVSEVVTLKKENIDLSRRVIHIKQGKGRKDRYTILSEKATEYLIEYCSFYNIHTWLFPGCPETRHLSIRSAQSIFEKAIYNAGIYKNISIHCLRHTFATHLLENGIDIHYIQKLLGHSNLRTTERYAHIARRSVLSIQSPLDTF